MKKCFCNLVYSLFLILLSSCASSPPPTDNVVEHKDGDRTLVRRPPAAEPQLSPAPPKSVTTATANNKHALLIGVGEYEPPYELEGPPNDVEDLEQALLKNWAFSSENITKLVNKDATKSNILQEIKKMQETTKAGDEIFIYFSGHGTSAKDEGFGGAMKLPYSSGAIVPYGFKGKDSLIVGKTDLKPLLTKLDQGDRHMLVVFDSCYSGNSVRSLFSGGKAKTKARFMKLPASETDSSASEEIPAASKSMARVEDYPYRNIVYMSAAQENETANDIPGGSRTFDGQAHGAFTDALLRILNKQSRADINSDGNITFQEIYESSKDLVAQQHWPQTPMALPLNSGNSSATALPVFNTGSVTAATVKPTAPANNTPLRLSVSALGAEFQSALTGLSGVQLDDSNPDLVIAKSGNGKLTVATGSGDRITDDLGITTPQQLSSWVQSRAAFDKLVKQSKSKADFAVSLELGNGLAGSAVIEGQRFNFTLQAERAAYLLLLSVNAQNQINVLYPFNAQELEARDGNKAIHFPGMADNELIEATAPFGSDQLLLLAFDASTKRPEILDSLMGKDQLSIDALEIKQLQEALQTGQAHYAASSLSLVSVSKADASKLVKQ